MPNKNNKNQKEDPKKIIDKIPSGGNRSNGTDFDFAI
jgi:hypothetical protein